MEKMMQLAYDQEGDVLYLSIGDPRPAISEELGDDVLLRVSIDTGEVVGLTILNFSSRFGSSSEPHSLPVKIALQALAAE